MSLILESRQEAALNAAGEALLELKKAGLMVSIGTSDYAEGFRAWSYAKDGEAIWGRADMLADAVRECLFNVEQHNREGIKLKTAAEAVDKIKELVGDNPELVAKIDALPVKR